MNKTKENKQIVTQIYTEQKKKRRPHRPTERQREQVNTTQLQTLPVTERMFILNIIGRKTKKTPFVPTYYCHCGQTFYDKDDYSPRDYRVYRREVICPYCFKCNFNEHPQKKERRPTATNSTRAELIQQYFNLLERNKRRL